MSASHAGAPAGLVCSCLLGTLLNLPAGQVCSPAGAKLMLSSYPSNEGEKERKGYVHTQAAGCRFCEYIMYESMGPGVDGQRRSAVAASLPWKKQTWKAVETMPLQLSSERLQWCGRHCLDGIRYDSTSQMCFHHNVSSLGQCLPHRRAHIVACC